MKDFFDVLRERRSIRKFKDKEVPLEIINKIIDSARYAPSGMNKQPWEFIVVTDKDKKKQIREIYEKARKEQGLYEQDCSFVEKATIIIVCNNASLTNNLISTSLAIENMLLAATALNLGSIIITAPLSRTKDIFKIRVLCRIPLNLELVALVLIGYADEKPAMKERKALKEILHNNVYKK